MRFTSSAHPSTTTHTLLREKQGQVDLERPLRRNLVIVIDGVVSDLAKQVDRLLAELHDSPHPGTYCQCPKIGSEVVGLRDIRKPRIPAFAKVLGEDGLDANVAHIAAIRIGVGERKTRVA